MAIPLIIAGAAGLLGWAGHSVAKETNEKAQSVSNQAQNMYDNAKASLENEQKATEQALLTLGNSKKRILDTSIARFQIAYERIKDFIPEDVGNPNELSNLSLKKQDMIELREMSDIYSEAFSSGATGVATGAIIALAVSGSLPVVTGTLSIAGSLLAMGEIGAAASLAGSALSFGAAMTPLSAIIGPAMLVTAFSASTKADENLEKANVMYAEAQEACEKMATAETLCTAITARANMYDYLLDVLDQMYAPLTVSLDEATKQIVRRAYGKRVFKKSDFTEQEQNLIAVARALTKAIKQVIATPILSKDGSSVSRESQKVIDDTLLAINPISDRYYNLPF